MLPHFRIVLVYKIGKNKDIYTPLFRCETFSMVSGLSKKILCRTHALQIRVKPTIRLAKYFDIVKQ